MTSKERQGDDQAKGTGKRTEYLPLIADAFVKNGYRRTTTAQLAKCCQARENELYRIWPNKKAMFLAAIQHVLDISIREWSESLDVDSQLTLAEQLLQTQGKRRGESQLHRVVFSGLSEIDDPEIRKSLRKLYCRFHEVLVEYVADHRKRRGIDSGLGDAETAWALIGMGSIFDIRNDLGIGSMAARRRDLETVSRTLLN